MKQLFNINTETTGDEQKVLSIRLGKRHCCFAISNKSATIFYRMAYITIDNWSPEEWANLFEAYPDLNHSFYEVLVSYDFSTSALIPIHAIRNNDSAAFLNSIYGIHGQSSIITEPVAGWQINNIYAVPTELQEWIQNKFPSARFWHEYSLGIRHSISSSINGTVMLDFRKEDFVAIVTGNNNILLTQTYEYTTPEDVLYYLIKICNQFSLSREKVNLQLSGLIDKNSSLYKELYQYFIHIDFRNAAWGSTPDHPAHFFTSLNDLAQCAS